MAIPTYTAGSIFMRAYRLLRRDVVASLAQYDLIPTSWALLGIVAEHANGVRLNIVAEALAVKAPLITTIADDLVNRGIIVKADHPTDKRAKLLVVTADGKKFMKKVEQDVKVTLDTLLKGVSEPELEQFRHVLETIINNAID